MNLSINPKMITLAREARGFTQQDLAERIHTQKAHISKIEHGDLGVNKSMLESISEATAYPLNFFYQQGEIMPANLSYRRCVKVPAKLITPVEAKINIVRNNLQFLTRALSKQSPLISTYTVDEENTPNKIAEQVRANLKIQSPVIDNLTKIVEAQGIAISRFDFDTDRIDSRIMLTDDRYPIIFLNKRLLGDRLRFSLAFELAHLFIHTYSIVPVERDIKHEANLFAAELLMPADAILEDFKNGVSVPILGELKRKWKVSMISLLYRADDLGLLTSNQKRYLVQQFNQLKIRRREPVELDIPQEEPQLIKDLVCQYCNKEKVGLHQMVSTMALELEDYIDLYC